MHDLSDQAAPDHPYAQPAGHIPIHPGRNNRANRAGTFQRPYTRSLDGVNRALSR